MELTHGKRHLDEGSKRHQEVYEKIMLHYHFCKKIQQSIEAQIPQQLKQRFQVANIRFDVIVIYTSHATIATRLRMILPSIIARDSELNFIKSIELRVHPENIKPEKQPTYRQLSSNARQTCLETASRLASINPELAEVFTHIAHLPNR